MAHDILVVDDELDIRMQIAGILSDDGYETREAENAETALAAIQQRCPSLIILDIWLQGSRMDGMELLKRIQHDHPGLPTVMISGHGTIEMAVKAIRIGAYDFVEKPFKADRLLLIVQRALETMKLKRENEDLRLRFGVSDQMIGNSSAMKQLNHSIDKIARSNSRVMIFGEPGSGKELTAKQLHVRSSRANNPFIVMNCATMKPEYIEEQLFGVDNVGSDSDKSKKIGLFEQAHGGTLFLDEIGDMPLETQSKIVQALHEQTFKRLGGTASVTVDVRVISSTNKNIEDEIEQGRFRRDLFYRINVVSLEIPSLRNHREDIPLLVDHFIEQCSKSAGVTARKLREDALIAMQIYDWPGNIRQLKNVIEGLLIMAPGSPAEPITAEMLPGEIVGNSPGVMQWDKGHELMTLPLRDAREIFERDYLLAQIHRFNGNVSRTAAFIGMERSALHRKLKALDVPNVDRNSLKAKTEEPLRKAS
jgi:two-component system, NtrC family, nitrogen regulation response regulator NtrX